MNTINKINIPVTDTAYCDPGLREMNFGVFPGVFFCLFDSGNYIEKVGTNSGNNRKNRYQYCFEYRQ